MADYEDYYRSQGLVPNADGTKWVKPNWVDAAPLPLQNPDSSPADIAAFRVSRAVKRSNPLPVADDRGSPFSGPVNAERPSYLMEPDLQEAQGGMHFPAGLMQNDAGQFYYADKPNEFIQMARRPNILPIAQTPEGIKFVTPKMLDLVGNVMGNVVAPKVAAKAGEMVLGSGVVRTAEEAKAASGPFYSALEKAVEGAKVEKADAQQWMGYLRNQPGVKAEEINTVLKDLPEGQITKAQLDDIVKQNKVELKEKVLGDSEHFQLHYKDTLPRRLSVFGPVLDEIKDLSDIALAKKHNSSFRETVKNIGDIKAFEAVQEAKGLPKYDHELKQFDTRAEAEQHIKNLQGEQHIDIAHKRENVETKYHQYQLPGGENYKEMLLSLPNETSKEFKIIQNKIKNNTATIEDQNRWDEIARKEINRVENNTYNAPHFGDEGKNLLAHIRHNDRTIEGKKALHIEELQSDIHQNGRKFGYKGEYDKLVPEFNKIEEKLLATNDEKMLGLPKIEDVLKEAVEKKIITKDEANVYKRLTDIENYTHSKAVPDFPFKKNWDELALKRMIHKAANEGYDAVSWTPGGNQPTNPKNLGNASAEQAEIADHGLKEFYDKRLVDRANQLSKKHGSKVEQKHINDGNYELRQTADGDYVVYKNNKLINEFGSQKEAAEQYLSEKSKGQPIHYLPITPELRQKAKEGFPLFSSSPVTVPVDFDPFKKDNKYKLTPIEGNPFE